MAIVHRLRLRGNQSACSACGEVFWSVGAFDRHRIGKYSPLSRRCLEADEMRAAGMVQTESGFWQSGRPSGDAGSSLRARQTGGDRPEARP